MATPSPTQWSGDSWGGLSTGGWGTDGWEGSWGGSWEGNVKISGGSKSNKIAINVAGSKSNKVTGLNSVSSKSNKGYVLYASGVSSKSDKGYGLNVAGGKSNKGVGLNSEGYGINVSSVGSKSGASGIYINVAGSKSNKEGFSVFGGSSKSSKGPGQPVNPIQPIDGWNNDGHVPVPVPVPAIRGKWSGDGHVTPLVTPNPTPYPSSWKGDAHQTPKPTNKPVPSITTPAPSITTPSPSSCEERMVWHPNPDYTMCTNDENYVPDSPYIYISLETCCKALFGTPTCDFIDICQPEPIVTKSPSESPVTPAPTPCGDQVFFFDGETCSNEFYIADAPSYTNVMICCNMNFGAGSFIDGSCGYVDVCNTMPPSVSPSDKPSNSPVNPPAPLPTSNKPTEAPNKTIITPAPSPAPTACEERLWHPNPYFKFCTNDSNFPASWTEAENFDTYFYASLAECCMDVFGSFSCEHVDICVTPVPTDSPVTDEPSPLPTPLPSPLPTELPTELITPESTPNPSNKPTPVPIEPIITPSPSPAPTSCEERKWYIDGNTLICSNGYNMESDSNDTMNIGVYYNTLQECCEAEFGNSSCDFEDVCVEPIVTPVPTESPVTPAPTPCEAQVFFFDGNVCSNEFYIADAPAYNTAKACCNMNFGAGSFMKGSCEYVDICNTEPPTPSPVTPEPSVNIITPEPTDAPVTPAPTPCEVLLFFFDGETCSNEFFIADAPSYNSAMICCNTNFGPGSFIGGSCGYVDICNTLPPTPSPSHTIVTPTPTPFPTPALYIKTLPPTEEYIKTLPPTEDVITP